jgi:hypothetical protein
MSVASQKKWDDPVWSAKMRTPERRERRKKTSSENWLRSGRTNENAYSRCNGGRRADLGDMFFRSNWEANYARILNLWQEQKKIFCWEYEPLPFRFPRTDRPLSYTTDFQVWEQEGSDYYYVEIKGQMSKYDQLKQQCMEEHYTDVSIRMIYEKDYKNLQKEFAPRIETWEFNSSRYIAKRKAIGIAQN